jgi:hypothetical protein
MAALTRARIVPSKGESCGFVRSLPVAASTVIYSGALVMIDGSGNATPAAAASGNNALVVAGIAEETVDNSTGSAGDLSVRVRASGGDGAFALNNNSGAAIDATHVGRLAHASDDNTVANAASSTNRPIAGYVHSVDEDGFVYVMVPGRALA